jgi:hypothetical protein
MTGFEIHPYGSEATYNKVWNQFKISGRKFSTKNTYSLALDAQDLRSAEKEMKDYIDKNWLDQHTKFVAVIINLYDSKFNIMMYYMIIMDKRHNFSAFTDIKSRSGLFAS